MATFYNDKPDTIVTGANDYDNIDNSGTFLVLILYSR